jgi:hypothetical protein
MAMSWDWKTEGFAAPPTLTVARGGERLYRAWGGRSEIVANPNRKGACYSLDRARTRKEAEILYAIAEWGNSFWQLTTFEVPHGIPMWMGRVDPGDYSLVGLAHSGSQVFIQTPYTMDLKPVETVPLLNDLGGGWVHTGRLPDERLKQ